MISRKRLRQKEKIWLLNEKYAGKSGPAYYLDVMRLKMGWPLAYLIGYQPFLSLKIDLAYKPLIPRPETEYWAEKAILEIKGLWLKKPRKIKCLDLFAGSGCIGLAVLKEIPQASVDFVDIDKDCLKQIEKNCLLNEIRNDYRLIESDLFSSLGDRYDYIFANPPYISRQDKKIETSVLRYEPSRAIFSNQNGLELIKKFLEKAKDYLKKEGKIYLEFGFQQKKEIEKFLFQFGYSHFCFFKDQYGKWRWVAIFSPESLTGRQKGLSRE